MRLAALHDDATCAVLQFVPAGDVAQFVAPTCKRLRDLGRSDALLMLRRASDYHLRGDRATDSGAAHALATRLGTRPWPLSRISYEPSVLQYDSSLEDIELLAPQPPPQLFVQVHRVYDDGLRVYQNDQNTIIAQRNYRWAAVAPPISNDDDSLDLRRAFNSRGRQCSLGAGSFVSYHLPCMIRVSGFRLAYAKCSATQFKHWTFQAYYDAEAEWRMMSLANGVAPWSLDGYVGGNAGLPPYRYRPARKFEVDADFASCQYRILLVGQHCMHIRAFELYGTLCANWSLDQTPPSSDTFG